MTLFFGTIAPSLFAERFARQLGTYLAHERVLLFPDRADLPWDRTAPELEAVGARARACSMSR